MKGFRYLVTKGNTEMLFKTEREVSEALGIARPFLSLYLNGHISKTRMHKKHVDFFNTYSIRKLSEEEQQKYPNAEAFAQSQQQKLATRQMLAHKARLERQVKQLAHKARLERVAEELRKANRLREKQALEQSEREKQMHFQTKLLNEQIKKLESRMRAQDSLPDVVEALKKEINTMRELQNSLKLMKAFSSRRH